MSKAPKKQRKARAAQNRPADHNQSEVVQSTPAGGSQEQKPSQWRQYVEEMAAAEKKAAAQPAPAQPEDKLQRAKAEGKAKAEALLASAKERGGQGGFRGLAAPLFGAGD